MHNKRNQRTVTMERRTELRYAYYRRCQQFKKNAEHVPFICGKQ
jgi:hypothetical protein